MDFSKTKLYQRTRSCYDKLYADVSKKKSRERSRDRNQVEARVDEKLGEKIKSDKNKNLKTGLSLNKCKNSSQNSLIDEINLDDDDDGHHHQSKGNVEKVCRSVKNKKKFGKGIKKKGLKKTVNDDALSYLGDNVNKGNSSVSLHDDGPVDLIDDDDDDDAVVYLGDDEACLDSHDPSNSSRVESNEVKMSHDAEKVESPDEDDIDTHVMEPMKNATAHDDDDDDGNDDDMDDVINIASSSSDREDDDMEPMNNGSTGLETSTIDDDEFWCEVSRKVFDDDDDDCEGMNKKKFRVYKPGTSNKRRGTGYDMWVANEGGSIKKRKTETDRTFIEKQNQFGKNVDVIGILADNLKDGDGEKLLKSYVSPMVEEIPVKKVESYSFKFDDDEIIEQEKSEIDVITDGLFEEMNVCLQISEIGCSDTSVVNCGDIDCKMNTLCQKGEHLLTINDEFGIICRRCSYVEMEIRDILPPLIKNGKLAHGKHECDHEKPDNVRFSDIRVSDDHHDSNTSKHVKGTVWDLVPGVKESMYPHQREGFEFIWEKVAGGIYINNLQKRLSNSGTGCIISHAPGTGKSRLALVFLKAFLKMYPDSRPLIIAPRSMLLTWKEQFEKWDVNFPFHNLNNNELSGDEDIDAANFLKRSGQPKSVICKRLLKLISWKKKPSVLGLTYRLFETLAGEEGKKKKKTPINRQNEKVKEFLLSVPTLLVLDEGHTPRNDQSLMWKALVNVKTNRKIILTGTPFQNNFDELFNTMCLVNPSFSFGISSYKKHGRKHNSTRGQWDSITNSVKRDRLKLDELKAMIDPFVHVHKGEILQAQLPGLKDALVVLKPTKTQQTLLGMMSGTSQTLENNHTMSLISVHPSLLPEGFENNKFNESLNRFKNDPRCGVKTEFLIELIKLSGALNEKVLVFSQYIKPLEFIKEMLKTFFKWTEGREFLYMDGQQEEKLRQNSINTVNDSKSEVKILLASLKACSEGINLVGASRVVLLDVHWNPSVERQAISRAYRLGQKKMVYVYHLVTGSMEGEKYIRQVEKSQLSELVFASKSKDGSNPVISSMVSGDEILEELVQHEKLQHMFEKVIYQPKEADLINTFGLIQFTDSIGF